MTPIAVGRAMRKVFCGFFTSDKTAFTLSYPWKENMALKSAVPMLYPLFDVPLNDVWMSKLCGCSTLRCPERAAKPVQTMNSSVNSLTALRISCRPLPIRGATEWMPTAKAAAAMATPRSFQVVDSTPAAKRRYEDAVMALLAETSVLDVSNSW